ATTRPNGSGQLEIPSYGATASSSSSTSSRTVEGTVSPSSASEPRLDKVGPVARRNTDAWMDISAWVLVVFGMFVMVIATTMTVKKMLSAV
ncbi:hypothetical protein BGX31_008291, partial [Mortierella sp. GBA43]